jgi:hypothetical protein
LRRKSPDASIAINVWWRARWTPDINEENEIVIERRNCVGNKIDGQNVEG